MKLTGSNKRGWVLVSTMIAIAMLLTRSVMAANSATVNATVTAQNVSLTVGDGVISYGALEIGASTTTTTTGAVHDSQSISNTGNIIEKINIKGQDSTAWTLSSAPGPELYTHSFCVTNCDASPTWTPLTTDYATLAGSVGIGSSAEFDLKIQLPTSTANFSQQNVDVTIQATLP